VSQRQKPVLASDVLREDLCPNEPGARSFRVVLGLCGAIVLACAGASLRDPLQFATWMVPGVTALLVAFAPTAYATRALLAFAPSAAAVLMQSLGAPGARTLGGVLYATVACGLPAALLFRAHFRASRRARLFVLAAIVLAITWMLLPRGGALLGPAAPDRTWLATHITAVALAPVVLLSMLGFMGANTSGGCRAWAVLAVLWSAVAPLAEHTGMGTLSQALHLSGIRAAVCSAGLVAIASTSAASLAAVYLRPREPSTGIGASASGNTGPHAVAG
jgi:hypothetical protein